MSSCDPAGEKDPLATNRNLKPRHRKEGRKEVPICRWTTLRKHLQFLPLWAACGWQPGPRWMWGTHPSGFPSSALWQPFHLLEAGRQGKQT
jgi:hypothetical protein